MIYNITQCHVLDALSYGNSYELRTLCASSESCLRALLGDEVCNSQFICMVTSIPQ